MQSTENSEPSDYDLKVDEQTDRFLTLKHQLTYFLVTAAIVPTGFTLKFAIDYTGSLPFGYWSTSLLAAAGAFGLLAAGCALGALRSDIASHRMHIATRYLRQSYEHLTQEEKRQWDRHNVLGRCCRDAGFCFLILAIVLQAAFFCLVLIKKGG